MGRVRTDAAEAAIGNTGEFNGLDPDIRHSAAHDVDTNGDSHYLRWSQVEEDLQRAHAV